MRPIRPRPPIRSPPSCGRIPPGGARLRIVALCLALACARELAVPPPSQRPVITSYSPTSAYENAVLTIAGKNFDPVAANNTVQFTAKSARAYDFDAQHNLLVYVPGGTYND